MQCINSIMDIFFCTQKKKLDKKKKKLCKVKVMCGILCELLIVAKYENYIAIISNEVHFLL